MRFKILIVEDEPAIAENIRYSLETDGFETMWYSRGQPVLPILEKERIDLIILDIGLPDINGMELCKQIRAGYTIPIVFLTARSDEIDRVVGLEIGGDDYIVKPFSPRELSARIKAILRRTQNNKSFSKKIPSASPFQIDEERCQILYFTKVLDLSRYEYKLLKIFTSRPGRIFSRDQLMDLVWDEPEMSMDRTVDAHIKNIRAKLKKVKPDLDPIKTHRSIGYSLKEDI